MTGTNPHNPHPASFSTVRQFRAVPTTPSVFSMYASVNFVSEAPFGQLRYTSRPAMTNESPGDLAGSSVPFGFRSQIVTNTRDLGARFTRGTPAVVDIAPSILAHLRVAVPAAVADSMDGVSFLRAAVRRAPGR